MQPVAQTYACSPKVVGGPDEEGHSPPQCPVEETRCPVVAHDWVNDEYKHLVVKATPKALAAKPGQFFQLLCPSTGCDRGVVPPPAERLPGGPVERAARVSLQGGGAWHPGPRNP